MDRNAIINKIGMNYYTPNNEEGGYSYVQEAGSKSALEKALGRPFNHFKLDIRFELNNVVVLIETKQNFTSADEKQLAEYVAEEKAIHSGKKIIAMLANTTNNDIKVWKSDVNDNHILDNETVIDSMEHYVSLFDINKQNNREKVLKNTYALNELLHKKDIDERLRSQFVGTILLHIKQKVNDFGFTSVDDELIQKMKDYLSLLSAPAVRTEIESTLTTLLDGSDNKKLKIELLQKNVLNNQKVKALKKEDWQEIFNTILTDIYQYIDADSSEGQDILNLFFIAFNKYTGKADRNQAFSPDHITEFMCRITDVNKNKIVLDSCCGSGSFLVQAMVKELADCRKGKTESEYKALADKIKQKHIYGIEIEEKAYGLSTTNMLIHGDGNSNIEFGSCFEKEDFIKKADPDIFLLNPPYNAKPLHIPEKYKKDWKKDIKEDPTKGLCFVHFLSDVIEEMNNERERNGEERKLVKLAVLLPLQCAIGSTAIIENEKRELLKSNTLEAVFSLPAEIFYPGASVNACCMLFTLGQPHTNADGDSHSTFFGYCREDGFVKKKNLGRIERFDEDGNSIWKNIEANWIRLFKNKEAKPGLSAIKTIGAKDEWLCEAYMKTDYTKLTKDDFQRTLNNYLSYLVKEGTIYED
jgi:type I restriction-modification system DNA methylase subunit